MSNNNNSVILSKSLQQNIDIFKQIFKNDETIIYRVFENKSAVNIKYCAIFVSVMVEKTIINDFIIKPLMYGEFKNNNGQNNSPLPSIIDLIIKRVVLSGELSKNKDVNTLIDKLLYGSTIIFVEGESEALIVNTRGWKTRSIEDPEGEKTIKGRREGFIEDLATNLSLIRKTIRSPKLKFIFMEVGNITKTQICISYMEGIASEKILQEVKSRLQKIDHDEILYSENIEEFIKDSPFSVFKTIGSTERPDVVCGKLMEGRIAIVCDGTPFVLTLPFIFQEYFQSADDYANNYLFASFNRLLRMICFILGLSVPALYVSVTTFHQELIPTSLLLSISNAREGLPFPTVVEAISMLLGFDLLREAGTRLPKAVGQAVSIVGALVLGEAAVSARLVSAPMVIMIAVTGISSFLIPKMLGPLIITRLIFLILSAFMGLYGYVFGVIGLFIYLFSVRSFGIPYMIYTGEIKPEYVKDTLIRAPWYSMYLRPKFAGLNIYRRRNIKNKSRRGSE